MNYPDYYAEGRRAFADRQLPGTCPYAPNERRYHEWQDGWADAHIDNGRVAYDEEKRQFRDVTNVVVGPAMLTFSHFLAVSGWFPDEDGFLSCGKCSIPTAPCYSRPPDRLRSAYRSQSEGLVIDDETVCSTCIQILHQSYCRRLKERRAKFESEQR